MYIDEFIWQCREIGITREKRIINNNSEMWEHYKVPVNYVRIKKLTTGKRGF